MNHVKLTNSALDIEEIINSVTSESTGAISSFIGTTRDTFETKSVKKLVYEAYIPMAEKKMIEICKEIRSKWNVFGICIIHRLGEVKIKEASVVIAISSVHREDSLQAVHFAIERLKQIVPIWKLEEYDDNSSCWKENKILVNDL